MQRYSQLGVHSQTQSHEKRRLSGEFEPEQAHVNQNTNKT